jgi:rod shape-determining protein MreC
MSAPRQSAGGAGRGQTSLGLRFVLLSVTSLALMLLDHQEDHLTRIRQGLSVAVYPIRVLVDLPFSAWGAAKEALQDREALLAENGQLKRERLAASVRLQRMAALEVENARLRELLESTETLEHRVLIAEILAVSLDPYRQRFRLNKGSADGVFIGQALLDADGLVGQVVSVGPLSAEAVLITDADHAVPVTVNRNGLHTFAVGTGDSNRLRLPYLTNSADIQTGDLLVSSGLGGVFPSGYPVGRVIEVRARPGQSFADVIAEPASELDRDQEVLLVFETGTGEAGEGESPDLADLN